ncbi:hypothetical protein [Natrinema salsiterrestre]|uniref:Uncharacterized protein n=1 Tax=Natrinema salsiterrestre TaxID=2950540 RepID=A0A9Q4Q2K8_9EURY|nr:hypothetical protein [Natrinema salsiterrestre]MDF9748424.1 hypothetical protein [Natrinema salsiterrestre]
MSATNQPRADDLPNVRFVDRFVHDGEVFYASRTENRTELYRVTGTVDLARALLQQEAVIYDETICRSAQYEDLYRTVDLYHHMAGRVASITVDAVLDEPAIALEEVDRL